MAIELCSDNNNNNYNNSTVISPRISFSHDFCLSDVVPIEQHPLRPSSIDFDFCTRKSFDQESSLADELFSDGKILPTTEIRRKPSPAAAETTTPASDSDGTKKEAEENKQSGSSKSFWKFKRSSSLNCVSGYSRSLCPLPLLSRSNSTGSTPSSVRRAPLSKENSSQKLQKQGFAKSQSSSSSSNHQKPPLKKNYGPYYANGVRVNPVLNLPSGTLFGLGSIFSNNGKDKNKKK